MKSVYDSVRVSEVCRENEKMEWLWNREQRRRKSKSREQNIEEMKVKFISGSKLNGIWESG